MTPSPSLAPPAAAATPAAPATARTASRRIVDAPTRMAHALIALAFVGAYLTAEGERWRAWHVTLGYVLAVALAFRVVYGLVGPRPARVSAWFRKLAAAPPWWRAAVAAARDARPGALPWRQGQNLAMAAVIAAIVLALPVLLLSGLAPHLGWVGGASADALSELHEALGEAVPGLVLLHVGLVLTLSLLRRQNQARPMLDGRVPGTGPDLARRNHGALALLLAAAAAGIVAWQWPPAQAPGAPSASAASEHRHGDDDD